MPKVSVDDEYSQHIIDLIMANYESREGRDGKWHVSDLLFPRYAVLSRLTQKKPTREEIGFFLTGEAYHEFLQRLLGEANSEVRGELHGVLGTADYCDDSVLLEIKTSRKWTIPEFPQEHYIDQAAYYCAIFKKLTAKILIIFPTANRKWDGKGASTVEVRAWTVTFDKDEIKAVETRMKDLTKALTKALETQNVDALPPCPDWKLGSIQKEVGGDYYIDIRCPFSDRCKCGAALYDELDAKNNNPRRRKTNGKKGN